jgi:hypothetical protein
VNLIGLEEHFVTPEVLDAWRRLDPQWQDLSLTPSTKGESARRLADLGDERLRKMNQTGLDVQVLSGTWAKHQRGSVRPESCSPMEANSLPALGSSSWPSACAQNPPSSAASAQSKVTANNRFVMIPFSPLVESTGRHTSVTRPCSLSV